MSFGSALVAIRQRWRGAIPTFALTLAQRAGFDLGGAGEPLSWHRTTAMRMVAPVYALQDVFQLPGDDIEALKAAFAGKVVLLGAALDV